MLFDPGYRSLRFAVRPRVALKYFGELLVPLAALTAVPMGYAAVSGQHEVALRYLAVVVGLGALGWTLARLRCVQRMQRNEAFVVSASVFIVAALVMTVPMSAYDIAYVDALFETVSAVTTTGLSTAGDLDVRPDSFHFARGWMQWVGGLGVVVLALALLIDSGPAAKQLGFGEREVHDIAGGTRGHARRIGAIYVLITAAGFVALLVCGLDPLEAVVHTFAAVSTGGFSTHDASLAGIDGGAGRAVVIFICFAGAISFGWYYGGWLRKPLKALRDERLLALLGASALSTLLLYADGSSWAHASVLAASAQTTAGFAATDVAALPAFSKLVLCANMLIGGETGSTAGGIKILRFLIVLRLLELALARASTARSAVLDVRVSGERVTPREVEAAVALISGYFAVIVASWFAFIAYGFDPMNALFDVISAVTTTGLSAGVTDASLPTPLKLVLCLDMLMGRVEILALIVLVYPGTWFGKRRSST